MQQNDQGSVYRPLPVSAGLRPFVRRFMVADCEDELDVRVRPVPTGYCYLGWIMDGRVSADIDGVRTEFGDRVAHISGQIHCQDIEVRYQGRLMHVLVEMTATGLFALLGQPAGSYSGKTVDLGEEALNWVLGGAQGDRFVRPDLQSTLRRIEDYLSARTEAPFFVPTYITQATEMIEADPDGMMAGEVAAQLGVSARHLSRGFKKYIGVPPNYFRRIMQIQRAIALVTTGDESTLTQICLDCGFYDQAHFIHAFNRFFLTSPKAFFDSPDPTLLSFLSKQDLGGGRP